MSESFVKERSIISDFNSAHVNKDVKIENEYVNMWISKKKFM